MPKRIGKMKICPTNGCGRECNYRAEMCRECRQKQRTPAPVPVVMPPTPAEQVAADRQESRSVRELKTLKGRYAESLKAIERYEHEIHTIAQMKEGLETYTIVPSAPTGANEATVVVVASDWHLEEKVGAEVGGLNVFTADIAGERIRRLFTKAHRLTELLAKDIEIPTMVLALLGDFISNDIHEESVESSGQQPMHAIVTAQNHIISGIEYLLAQAPNRKLVIPCHSGNHARTTKTTRFYSENGHSLEYLLYQHLAAYFRHDSRVTFIIPEGPHSYLDIYDVTVRFQHGHMVKYGGGVGGIYIPVHKAIAQWTKARHADLDIFGHFHQLVDGGNFVCNGSLIGYNSFALSIKASYEKPKQALLLIDRKRGRTCLWPIYL